MNCPKDKTELKQITKDNVVIDFCPACKGVWLDRGELDKIIERSVNDYQEGDINRLGESSAEAMTAAKSEDHVPYTNKSNRSTTDTSYLAALFDMDSGSVNDRTRFMKNDDIR